MTHRLMTALVACTLLSSIRMVAQGTCTDAQAQTIQLKVRGRKGETKAYPVKKIGTPVLFTAGMHVDADGAPNAYGPENKGLDSNANAKDGAGAWVGVVTGADGKPVIQQSGEFKGFYVSTTTLQKAHADKKDPATYVDATKIPYVALTPALIRQYGIKPGDMAVVTNLKNGKQSFALYADTGNSFEIGEGSVALANALGLKGDPRKGGTDDKIIAYLIFPKSGKGQGTLRTVDEINSDTAKLFQQWGGGDKLKGCAGAP